MAQYLTWLRTGDYNLLNENRISVGKILEIMMTLWKHIPEKDYRGVGATKVFGVVFFLERARALIKLYSSTF